MLNEFSRTELLLGGNAMEKLKNARVAVFGVGGVGGRPCLSGSQDVRERLDRRDAAEAKSGRNGEGEGQFCNRLRFHACLISKRLYAVWECSQAMARLHRQSCPLLTCLTRSKMPRSA